MALVDLATEGVLEAISEFDRLGREPFLAKYGFGAARKYFLVHNARKYDSKAIAGVAHRYSGGNGRALTASEFSGGEDRAVSVLRGLGFEIHAESISFSNPFEIGRIYSRRKDVHQLYGGQEQGGIATPRDAPFVFLFTGQDAKRYGYSDGWTEGEAFAYTGEGQTGDPLAKLESEAPT